MRDVRPKGAKNGGGSPLPSKSSVVSNSLSYESTSGDRASAARPPHGATRQEAAIPCGAAAAVEEESQGYRGGQEAYPLSDIKKKKK